MCEEVVPSKWTGGTVFRWQGMARQKVGVEIVFQRFFFASTILPLFFFWLRAEFLGKVDFLLLRSDCSEGIFSIIMTIFPFFSFLRAKR